MKYAAELFGTFVLVFAGLTTAVIAGGQVHNVGVAMAFGLSLLAMAYALGPVSGCHINPAVTLGMLLSRRMNGKEAVGYWIAQCIGGIIGAGVVLFLATHAPGGSLASLAGAANGYAEHSPGNYTMWACFVAETFLTMLLVFTVLGATDDRAPAGFAGIPIGFILSVIILAGIPITNGSFNPARSIGPAIWVRGWALDQLWLFIVAPMLGGVMAARLYLGIRVPAPMITARQAETALPSHRAERRDNR
ncbi:MAG TPA: MIP family channel protein [Candidatus Sulfotelmatobacter sp.]|jgi:aquaporin Z|nr:MIP family channel protein [Candidatus Sulfotelmatobacter sp.]